MSEYKKAKILINKITVGHPDCKIDSVAAKDRGVVFRKGDVVELSAGFIEKHKKYVQLIEDEPLTEPDVFEDMNTLSTPEEAAVKRGKRKK